MTVKTFVFAVLALMLVAAAALTYYFVQLTAPVQVATTLPVAPTLAVPAAQSTSASAAAAPAQTPAAGMPFPQGTPPAGMPQGGPPAGMPFPQGTPPAGMPPGGMPPDMGGAAAPVSTAPPAAPTIAATTNGAKVYRIDATQSQASYSVSETFLQAFAGMQAGQTTTVGTTKAIAGDILVDSANPSASQIGQIVIDISQLTSDIAMRDNASRRQWLESAQYPLATFQNATVAGLPASWPQGQPVKVQIAGDLTVHGATQHVTWDATITLDGSTLNAQATTTLKMSQFGIQAPSLPMLAVEDPATITLNLIATATGGNS